jgi:hypothetical protein
MVKQSRGSSRHRKSGAKQVLKTLSRAILIALLLLLAGVAGWFLGAIFVAASGVHLT